METQRTDAGEAEPRQAATSAAEERRNRRARPGRGASPGARRFGRQRGGSRGGVEPRRAGLGAGGGSPATACGTARWVPGGEVWALRVHSPEGAERRRGTPSAEKRPPQPERPGPPHRSRGARACERPRAAVTHRPGKRPAAILNRLPPPRAPGGTGSPPAPSPRGAPGGGRQAGPGLRAAPTPAQPSPLQPSLLTTSPLLSSPPPPSATVPAPASPIAPRLRKGAWLTVKTSPASPRPPSYCQSPQRNSLPPSRPRLPRLATPTSERAAAIGRHETRQPPLTVAIGGAVAMAPSLSRPPGTAHGRLRGCHGARAHPSAARGWREAEPRFQTAAKAPRRVWALSHGLRREQVQTWPRCSPRGGRVSRKEEGGGTATLRPRRAAPSPPGPAAFCSRALLPSGPGSPRRQLLLALPRPSQSLPLPGAAAPRGCQAS